ncbi:uncharacterized protein LOC111054842 [Nilaparvata lugens]|uniref:uncharacterized protein LOC111054842 n=1 Tax=Nilaparvata lugens TaxID=108931 RepID=UPI00193D2B66|nr:uncharacterized protein LOC111054842 [Nilaparvata lugens]
MTGKRLSLLALLVVALATPHVASRAVNISSAWLLPEEGFPVFYRYFRDRITWFEADAVCQFHHAQLVTVDWSTQYDAARAYLKELDVTSNVWIGLKRANAESDFTWTDYKGLESGGYWAEALPTTDTAVCAALDPAADFRWHPLNCGGPEVASFICQLEVPVWARQEDGCMLTSLPSLTVTYLPEQGAVELISDCGLEGTRRIACKGQANREEMMKQLSCETSTEATSSGGWGDNELPTRHRRDTDVTPDMASEQSSLPTTEGLTEVDVMEEVTVHPASMDEELQPSTTLAPEVSSQVLPQEMSAAEEPVQTSPELLQEEINSLTKEIAAFNSTTKPVAKDNELAEKMADIPLPDIHLKHNYAGITSDEASETNPAGRRNVVLTSKPLPPSLRGNSPFIEPSNTTSKSNNSSEEKDDSKPIEKESHEVFREAKSSDVSLPEKTEGKVEKGAGVAVFPPLSVYPSSKEESEEVTSAENHTSSLEVELHVKATNNGLSTTESAVTTGGPVGDDAKFFVRVNTEVGPTEKPTSTQRVGSDSDFLFVLTESPEKAEGTSVETSKESMVMGAVTQQEEDEEQALEEGTEPEAPERPNRGRLLVRPQHHSFYPSLLNRVLG